MSAHTTAGGGVSTGAFGGGAAVANRFWWTSDGSNFLTGENARFDGTNVALGGALISGRRLAIYMESSGVGWQVNGFANNQDANWLLNTPDARLLIGRMYGGTTAGTINGLNAAALAILEASNTANLLLGGTDVRTSVRSGANVAAFLGGTLKTFTADASHDGTGTDVFYTYSIPGNTLRLDGDCITFDYEVSCAATANNKTVLVAYGATTLGTFTAAKNGGSVRLKGRIIRTGATTQRAVIEIIDSSNATRFVTVTEYTTPGETLSGSVAIELRGTATVAADLVARFGHVGYTPAGN